MAVARTQDEETVADRKHKPGLRRVPDRRRNAVAGLGNRLRSARETRGLGLRALARKVDVSPSLISQIERGTVVPSVGTLYAIMNELDLGLDELFQKKPKSESHRCLTAAASRNSGHVCRSGNRELIRLADGVRWELLTPKPDSELKFLHVTYEPGAESCEQDKFVRHSGQEYAYIVSGRLGIRIGPDVYELGPGDSVTFDAQSPHRLWTIGDSPAVAIWVIRNRAQSARTRWINLASKRKSRKSRGRR